MPVLSSEKLVLEQHSFILVTFAIRALPAGAAAGGAELREASLGAALPHFCSLWMSAPPSLGRPSAATTGGRPSDVSFVFALNKAHVLALNTAHALRLNKADVLALNKAHVLRLNTETCPVFTANIKETTKGEGGRRSPPFRPPPSCWL